MRMKKITTSWPKKTILNMPQANIRLLLLTLLIISHPVRSVCRCMIACSGCSVRPGSNIGLSLIFHQSAALVYLPDNHAEGAQWERREQQQSICFSFPRVFEWNGRSCRCAGPDAFSSVFLFFLSICVSALIFILDLDVRFVTCREKKEKEKTTQVLI